MKISAPKLPTDDETETSDSAETIAVNAVLTSQPNPANLFFYDGRRYYYDTGKEYVPMDQRSVTRHLRGKGIQGDEADTLLCHIQTNQYIHFAGPLAGHSRGLHEGGGFKLLATESPIIIKPHPGRWDTVNAVINNLLGDDPEVGGYQVSIYLSWLKVARESLVTGRRRPGQVLSLAGPIGCGKSLLIDLTEAVLGGRRANPYPYFSGRTSFNADLAGAELLAVDDEAGSSDIRARKNLAANIKSNLFSGSVRIEGKGKTAFSLKPCWRMMMALNDEPEALLVLPPITEDVADKITMLRCHRRELPMPAHTLDERERFFATLIAELPALLHWLDGWQIPDDMHEDRCGVISFHHPELISTLHELSPEGSLTQLIDTAAAAGGIQLPWDGNAAQLKALLIDCGATSRDAHRLLDRFPTATGTYLGRLIGKRTEKLTHRGGLQRWRVYPSGAVE